MSLPSISSLPISSALQPRAAATSSARATGNGTSTPASGTDAIGSTFLSLLVQELQNQDPTAPMDSTAMVGQMISLNQLNQLTSINQLLNTQYGASPASGSTAQPNALTAAQAALRLLNANHTVTSQPAVSPSVTLPATSSIF